MRLETRADLRQLTKLAMTPQMHQSLSILQSSAYDLGNYLLQQSRENPFIEVDWSWHAPAFSRQYAKTHTNDSASRPEQWIASCKSGLAEHLAEQLRIVRTICAGLFLI